MSVLTDIRCLISKNPITASFCDIIIVENRKETRMINQQISDMMRRDTHFRERMEELGYSNKPIVAVIDWGAETIFTQQTN